MFGTADVLIPAIKLVGLPGIDVDSAARSVDYIHLLSDRHEMLCANGAESESLFPGEQALKSLAPEARAELLALFPALKRADSPGAPA